MKALTFRYTILYVENVVQTVEFYENAFGFGRKMLHESGDYAELATGNTILSFSSHKLMKDLGKNPGRADSKNPVFEIAFETDDVESALNHALAQGAGLIQAVQEMPWGQTIAYVTDINGVLIELCTSVSAS